MVFPPPKRGPPFKPEHPQLTTQVSLQAGMNQATGAGEATSRMLKNSVVAVTVDTEHEGKFNADYVVTSARWRHPEIFASVKAITNEGTRVQWVI